MSLQLNVISEQVTVTSIKDSQKHISCIVLLPYYVSGELACNHQLPDVNIKNKNDDTALMFVCWNKLLENMA